MGRAGWQRRADLSPRGDSARLAGHDGAMDAFAGISPAAAALHRRALVFDAHADTLTEMTDHGYDLDAAPAGKHLDFARCADGVLDAQVFTCFVHPQYVGNGAANR